MRNTIKHAYNHSPCHKCEERTVGCHSKCENYISYKKSHDRKLAQQHREKYINSLAFSPQILKKSGSKLQET